MLKGRFPALALAAFAPLAISACSHTNVLSAAERCDQQIVLSLAPGFTRTDRVIEDLGSRNGVGLDYLRSISPNLHVYRLTADGKDPGCQNALARLRLDSHVRFAEIDQRRSPN